MMSVKHAAACSLFGLFENRFRTLNDSSLSRLCGVSMNATVRPSDHVMAG
jgi:hypothetical protein